MSAENVTAAQSVYPAEEKPPPAAEEAKVPVPLPGQEKKPQTSDLELVSLLGGFTRTSS